MTFMINTTIPIVNHHVNNKFMMTAKSKIHLTIHTLLYIFLAFSSLYEGNLFTTIVSVTIIIYLLFSKSNEHFFFLIGFVPFEHLARIGEINVYFIFLLISSVKLIINNINRNYEIGGIISLIFLIFIEIMREFGSVSKGELLIVLSTIVYFSFFILLSDRKFYNMTRIVQNYCISYMVIILQIIKGYGSLITFFQMAATDTQIIRFGHESISVGGAMGVPLYSALLISMLISYYIVRPKINIKIKLLIIVMCIVAVVFGTLTISRSFLLTMVAWLIFIISSVFCKQKKKVFKVLLLTITISTIVYYVYADAINSVINNFLYRAIKDSGMGVRGLIWESCLNYLNSHPLGYLFGYGIRNYVEIGYKNSLLFSAMAHNLYIDIIMSIGIVGFICLIYLLYSLGIKVKRVCYAKTRLVTMTPLLVFLVFGFTALSLNNLKTWIYVLMLIIFAYAIPEESIKGGEVIDE